MPSICEVCSDSTKSNIQITDIQWQHTQDEIDFRPKVVDTKDYISNDPYPVDKTVKFSWSTEEQQSTTWNQQLSIGENFECEVNLLDLACSLKITYDHMQCTSTTSVRLSSKESKQVILAPKTSTIAQLVLLVSENAELRFIATIKSPYTSSEHKIEGVWRGTLYKLSSCNINVQETEIGIM